MKKILLTILIFVIYFSSNAQSPLRINKYLIDSFAVSSSKWIIYHDSTHTGEWGALGSGGGGGGSGTVTSVTGTTNRITITGTPTVVPVVDIAATYVGQTSITTLGTISTGVWNGTAIGNSFLANSSITIGSTNISLGATQTTLAGLTSVTSTTFIGSLTGNASTATNVAVGGITGLGTGVATALAINVGSAGAFVTFNGALGTPSSGTVTNLTGTASININGTVGATTPSTGAFTTVVASTSVTTPIINGSSSASGTLTLNSTSNGTKGVIIIADSADFSNMTIENYSAKYNNQTGTTYTLVAADNGKILTFNNASDITLTVPAGLPTGFTCTVVQLGGGEVVFTASSTTLHNRSSFTKTAGQYAVAAITMYTTDTFIFGGDCQ